jgi:DNA repair exonuclease SbcCD ATPase subunit
MFLNIATLVIVLVILFAFRRLDRDNRSLERVRKLADRLRDELSAYVEKRSDDLQRFGIELDVQQKAAKVALDKLQTVQEHLAGKTESIAEIEKRLTEYDKTLAGLMEMTSRVDENLARLQQEANFTESVNRKLDTARKSMDAIERELPLLREGFAQDAALALDRFKEGIISDIATGLENSSRELELARKAGISAVEKAVSAQTRIEAEFEEAFARARTEAATLENETYDKLKEASEAKALRLRDAIEEKFLSVGQTARTLAGEIQESIARFRSDWETEAGELLETARADMGTMTDSMAESMAAIEARVETSSREARTASEIASGAVAKASGDLVTLSDSLHGESVAMRDAVIADFDAKLGGFRAAAESAFSGLEEIGRKTEALDGELHREMMGTREKIEEDFAAFGQAFEDHRTRFEESFAGETSRLASDLSALRSDLDALKLRACDQAQAKFAEFEGNFFAGLEGKAGNIETSFQTWKAALDARVAFLAEEYEMERKRSQESHSEELRRGTAEKLARLGSESEKALEDAGREMRDRIDALASSVVAEEGSIRTGLEALAEDKARMKSEYDEALRRMDESCRSELGSFEMALRELVETSRKEYESQRNAFDRAAEADRRRLSEELARLEAEQKRLLAQTSTLQDAQAFKESLAAGIQELTGAMAGLEEKQAALAGLETQISKLKKTEEDLGQKMLRIVSEKTRLDSLEENVRKLATISQTVESRIADMRDHADELAGLQASMHGLAGMAADVESKYQRLEKKSSILDTTADAVDRNFQLMKNLEASIAPMEESLGTLPSRVAALATELETLAASKAKAEDTVRIVEGLDSALKEASRRVLDVQKAREWIARAESRLEELDRHANEQFKLLSSLLEESPGTDWSSVPANIQETVRKLGRSGWATEEIARTVKLSRSEVELIMELGATKP